MYAKAIGGAASIAKSHEKEIHHRYVVAEAYEHRVAIAKLEDTHVRGAAYTERGHKPAQGLLVIVVGRASIGEGGQIGA